MAESSTTIMNRPLAVVQTITGHGSERVDSTHIATNTTHLLVWVSSMDYSEYNGIGYFKDFTIPKSNLGSHTTTSLCPFFSALEFSRLKKSLGHGFAFSLDKTNRIHQGVAMMEILKFHHGREIALETLQNLFSQSDEACPLIQQGNSNNGYSAVIILDFDSTLECVDKLSKLSRVIQQWSSTSNRRLRLFPSIAELDWYHPKVNDILVLDEIANQAANSGRHDMAYRPKTCYTKGLCTLLGQNTTMKGSYSSETMHVVDLGRNRDPRLRCSQDNTSFPETSRRFYFHQETVSTFREIGEFRVLIATVPKLGGIRGREGNIELMVHTSYKGQEGRNPFFALSGSEAFWNSISPLNINQLRDFALFIFNNLRGRPDWKENYETLEIGVRLDIGVSPDGHIRSFFVNEITRFQQGCWFSPSSAAPYYGVPSAFARAIDEYFPVGGL
jgi:hypothetical protein